MAISISASVVAGSSDGSNVTTAAIDTSGATLLVMGLGSWGAQPEASVSDSKGNTWVPLDQAQVIGHRRVRLFYATNVSVGSGHTFTAAGTSSLPCIGVYALAGAHASAPFDQQNSAGSGGVTSLQTGSVTPSEDDEIIMSAFEREEDTDTFSIDQGFTILLNEPPDAPAFNHLGLVMAYLIQTTAGSVNPTWSWQNSHNAVAVIATFKEAAAGGGGSTFPALTVAI
jgi:hypothetical protein